jgi:hypothetical protein
MNVGAMKKKQTHSIARATLGAQASAYDFAYTDEKYFTTRTWYKPTNTMTGTWKF